MRNGTLRMRMTTVSSIFLFLSFLLAPDFTRSRNRLSLRDERANGAMRKKTGVKIKLQIRNSHYLQKRMYNLYIQFFPY